MTPRRRWTLAFAIAIAIHEIFFGFFDHLGLREPPDEPPSQPERIAIVRRTPRPVPTPPRARPPTPKPEPTPKPVPTVVVFAPVVVRATANPRIAHPVEHSSRSPRHSHVRAPDNAGGGGGASATFAAARHAGRVAVNLGAGTGSGGGTGSGTSGGNGPGSGGGNGSGVGGGGDRPCGFVEFIPYAPNHWTGGHFEEPIQANVSYRDGHIEHVRFPYPWIYAGNAEDPWSTENLSNPNMETPLQFPPPGTDTSNYDPLLKYILAHTKQNGTTDLDDCPSPAPR